MDKILTISGKEVGLRATALTPRLYRHKIGRDIIQDMAKLQKAFAKVSQLSQDATEEERQEAQFSVMDLEIFENVAFIMARQYDQNIPDTVDAWLDQFETFSIYEIFPEILSLWNMNNKTTSKPKKN